MPGPLSGVTVIELAGIGPGPFCAMMLADMGAEVIRVDRIGGGRHSDPAAVAMNALDRGRKSIAADIRSPEGRDLVLALAEKADVLMEGFRPGVTERLGLGPSDVMARNPKIVYGRMTGWGQTGPWSQAAGHDGVYLAITGALAPIGSPDRPPVPPLNMLGDFGGGGMLLAFGIACALFEAQNSGKGQVVDAAIVDGSTALTVMQRFMVATGSYRGREANTLDQGAPFYNVYECADGGHVSIGPIETKFSKEFLDRLGIAEDDELRTRLYDQQAWPALKSRLAALFKTKTRDEWSELLSGTDACVAPVLDVDEAPQHPHNIARNAFIELGGTLQPAPAPRFDRTVPELTTPAQLPGSQSREILEGLGYDAATIDKLIETGVVGAV